MRCPSCNKFVSEEVGAEWYNDPTLDGLVVSGSITLYKECAECGERLAEIEAEVEGEYTDAEEGDEVTFDEPEITDRYADKDRHGKPIKSFRYRKHYYRATATVGVHGEDIVLETDEFQGSEFEPL